MGIMNQLVAANMFSLLNKYIYIYYDTQQIFVLETWFGMEYHHDMLLYDIVCSFWGPVCGGL